jgi:hypothetical protein
MGMPSSATPTWDFDGAEILSGSGYGPYKLVWNSVGTKTVTLTIDDNTESRMIYVEANEANVELPSTMILFILLPPFYNIIQHIVFFTNKKVAFIEL